MGFILNQEVPDPSAFEIQPPQNTNINLVTFLESVISLPSCSMVDRTRKASGPASGGGTILNQATWNYCKLRMQIFQERFFFSFLIFLYLKEF